MEKTELIKLLEIANQRARHHHDALWKEETHYTWLIYTLVAGSILALNANDYLPIAAIVLSVIGIGICFIGFFVLKRETKFFNDARDSVIKYITELEINSLEPPQSKTPGISIQHYFRITLLIPILIFIVLIILSIIKLC